MTTQIEGCRPRLTSGRADEPYAAWVGRARCAGEAAVFGDASRALQRNRSRPRSTRSSFPAVAREAAERIADVVPLPTAQQHDEAEAVLARR